MKEKRLGFAVVYALINGVIYAGIRNILDSTLTVIAMCFVVGITYLLIRKLDK